jgi:hypothetical protein
MDTINPSSDSLEATSSHRGPTYPVDFIMDVQLQTKNGTDLPLYNKTLELQKRKAKQTDPFPPDTMPPSIKRNEGNRSDVFDSEKEDYWLFYVHLNNSELEIAIGGEEPIFVTSRPNWNTITDKDENEQVVLNEGGERYGLSWQYGAYGRCFDRFVAVRTPKMDNHYGGVHWVGLFTKTGVDNTNHFIAVRTSNRLLPDYAERTKQYPGYRDWYTEDGPVNILDCALTLFPKQLYGTTTNSPELYSKFVTQDPYNKVGVEHFEHVLRETNGRPPWPKRYTWAARGTTWIRIHPKFSPPLAISDEWFDYVSGIMLNHKAESKGWEVLFRVLGALSDILKGVFTISVAEVVGGIIKFGGALTETDMHQNADVDGFVTSITGFIDAGNKKRRDSKKKPAEKPNTTNILVLIQHIEAGRYSTRDLGSKSVDSE